MKDEPLKAWQPLTFGGVARYGHDWLGKLLFACFIVSILTASVVVWAASSAWFPVVEEAIAHLPPGAEIRGGRLAAPAPVSLAENLFLSISLDPVGEITPPSLADVQVVLKPDHIRFRSIFGMAPVPYRPEWTVPLTRADWEPKWPAWRPAVMAYLFFGTIAGLFASWIGLGILYAVPARIVASILKRSLSLWGAWKLCVAGLLPAAILLTVALGVYALGQIRITELMLTWILHFLVGWLFIAGAIIRLPRLQKPPKNPFVKKRGEDAESETEEEAVEKNPFKGRSAKKRR
jgi:hypothetical protein